MRSEVSQKRWCGTQLMSYPVLLRYIIVPTLVEDIRDTPSLKILIQPPDKGVKEREQDQN